MNETVLTPKEAAELLKLTAQTVIRLSANGKLPGAKIGGRWRFNREELLKCCTSDRAPIVGKSSSRLTGEQFDALVKRVTRGSLNE